MARANIKISPAPAVKTYVFPVEVEQEDDGRWSASVPVLLGCATWGYSKDEAPN